MKRAFLSAVFRLVRAPNFLKQSLLRHHSSHIRISIEIDIKSIQSEVKQAKKRDYIYNLVEEIEMNQVSPQLLHLEAATKLIDPWELDL